MRYIQFDFATSDENVQGFLIALLGEYEFEGFEETTSSLKAFIPETLFDENVLVEVLNENGLAGLKYQSQVIEERNWNAEWEKNFEPVRIANSVAIRAPFHQPMGARYELIIEPKMSFGTGHHSTTAAVIELMLEDSFQKKSVLDFGSGTGVLSILAEKLGAENILAIDNEQWAYENCKENAGRNDCTKIESVHGDESFIIDDKYDIILANINRNVILQNLKLWASYLKPSGEIIVSGILQNDELIVKSEAARCGLSVKKILDRNGWLAISFSHF